MKKNIIFLLTTLSFTGICAQQIDKHFVENTRIVSEYFHSVQDVTSPNELMVKAALSLLGTPYVGHALEGNREEQLVINLLELDCVTFVENCLALTRAAQYPYPDYENFVRQLQNIRYRSGHINGYTSRLHYTSDWIADNVDMGIIENITQALGGKDFQPNVGFMSANPERYPALKDNPTNAEIIKGIEQTINQRNIYYYIPKTEIEDNQALIQSGDIIGFTTSTKGMDISHVGMAYWDNDRLSFIHASSQYMKVVIEPQSLADYCKGVRTNTGIVVLRPKNNSDTVHNNH